METDKHFYELFEVNPQWIFDLTGRPSPGPCQFISITLKAIERRSDGVLVPECLTEPILVTELQMQVDREIYGRLVIEMALIQGERPDRNVEGIVIFGSRELDPTTEPWTKVVSAYYLDEMLDLLSKRDPVHPLVAVFQPLVQKNRELLEDNAAVYYGQIKSSASGDREKGKLLSVFVDWMMQRFSELGKQEIEMMLLGQLPNLRDTQAGKDLIAIGYDEGIEKGIEKGIETGIEKGALVGKIHICQSLLGLEMSKEIDLHNKSIDELTKVASELQITLRSRFGLK
jgi:predicted transposase YdaD